MATPGRRDGVKAGGEPIREVGSLGARRVIREKSGKCHSNVRTRTAIIGESRQSKPSEKRSEGRWTTMRRILAILGLVVLGFVIAVVTGWGALVLFYLAPGSESVRTALAWSFAALGLITVGALAVRRARRLALVAFAAALVLVLVAWSSPTPCSLSSGSRSEGTPSGRTRASSTSSPSRHSSSVMAGTSATRATFWRTGRPRLRTSGRSPSGSESARS